MALKTILNKQTDFTGEFPEEWAKGGLWRNRFRPGRGIRRGGNDSARYGGRE